MLTLNIQTPQVPGEITLNWTDFVTGEDGWRVQRSSDGVNFSWYKNVQIAHDDQTVRSTPCHWRALSVIAPAT